MRTQRICHRVTFKSDNEKTMYQKRQKYHIQHTPKIIMGRVINENVQEIWTDNLKKLPINYLRQLNSNQKAMQIAQTIISTSIKLSQIYGYFFINENTLYCSENMQIYIWINPDILENHVKIYLPHNSSGEGTMMRSIFTFLKLWIRLEYNILNQAKNFYQVLTKLRLAKAKYRTSTRKDSFDFQTNRSYLHFSNGTHQRYSTKITFQSPLIKFNHSVKGEQDTKSKQSFKYPLSNYQKNTNLVSRLNIFNISNEQNNTQAKNSKNTDRAADTNFQSQQKIQKQYQHNSFHTNHKNKPNFNYSLGFQNKNNNQINNSTSNKNKTNRLVELIKMQDSTPEKYSENKLLVDETKTVKYTVKESLDGIGEQINQLFLSNIESQQNKDEAIKKVEEQFNNILN